MNDICPKAHVRREQLCLLFVFREYYEYVSGKCKHSSFTDIDNNHYNYFYAPSYLSDSVAQR